jgi:hypothetical protein
MSPPTTALRGERSGKKILLLKDAQAGYCRPKER